MNKDTSLDIPFSLESMMGSLDDEPEENYAGFTPEMIEAHRTAKAYHPYLVKQASQAQGDELLRLLSAPTIFELSDDMRERLYDFAWNGLMEEFFRQHPDLYKSMLAKHPEYRGHFKNLPDPE